jgi:hypothetical protein
MPVKTGIHNDLKLLGFRVALATASLPGNDDAFLLCTLVAGH